VKHVNLQVLVKEITKSFKGYLDTFSFQIILREKSQTSKPIPEKLYI
jgi:hypothetical protein